MVGPSIVRLAWRGDGEGGDVPVGGTGHLPQEDEGPGGFNFVCVSSAMSMTVMDDDPRARVLLGFYGKNRIWSLYLNQV